MSFRLYATELDDTLWGPRGVPGGPYGPLKKKIFGVKNSGKWNFKVSNGPHRAPCGPNWPKF